MLPANISQNQSQNVLTAYQSATLEVSSLSISIEQDSFSASLDRVSLHSESLTAVTYGSDATMASGESRFELLRGLVANLLKEQGIDTGIPVGDREVSLESLSQEEARELVAEDGYFGVEQTSERIFRFGIGIAGGDPSRLDAIKQGVEEGFQEALDAFGGWLPEISYQTLDAVMEKLDSWAMEHEQAVA